ncbi:transposase [Thiolapillus sp.]|uniref:IS701 family transposase n=7 Tax=Thiolapillus sp. TaxID=2017437 RepID=UPI003AF44A95
MGTFIELLIGAMLSPAGFVTEAYLVVTMRNHWTSYYKWLQEGRWSWLALSRQFVRLIMKVVKQDVIHLVIDDTLTLRASKKAPGSQIHHQHGNKPNLARYVRGQCWVSLAWVIKRRKQFVSLPVLTRLVPGMGNTGKLIAAQTLIRAIYRLLDGRKVRVLVDSWYMRRVFIESMLARGFDVIGQVRIDTWLCDEPPKRQKGQRGRPRKYGRKYTPKRIAHLKRTVVTLPLYGKEQEVRYRSKVLMARFLKGRLVRVVWCELKSEAGHWKKAHLLLSTCQVPIDHRFSF